MRPKGVKRTSKTIENVILGHLGDTLAARGGSGLDFYGFGMDSGIQNGLPNHRFLMSVCKNRGLFIAFFRAAFRDRICAESELKIDTGNRLWNAQA